jgi:hypothetical protein
VIIAGSLRLADCKTRTKELSGLLSISTATSVINPFVQSSEVFVGPYSFGSSPVSFSSGSTPRGCQDRVIDCADTVVETWEIVNAIL